MTLQRQVLLQQPQVLVTGTRIDADSVTQVAGLKTALEQSQNRLEVAGQDVVINIEVTTFGIDIESLDRT